MSGMLTIGTNAPKIIAKPPKNSMSAVAHAIKDGAGTPIVCSMLANPDGPRLNFAYP